MANIGTADKPARIANDIPGYDYGSPSAARSSISVSELELLQQSAGFTENDRHWLRTMGEILDGRTKELVDKWREAIAAHPHLVQYSRRPDGSSDPQYSERSGLRFQQWVLDTCLRPWDQDWLNYQQEMALRHTSLKKNRTDQTQSAPTIHLRHIIAFSAVIGDPEILKPFLAGSGRSAAEIDKMIRAWSKSLWLQAALWSEPYTNPKLAAGQW